MDGRGVGLGTGNSSWYRHLEQLVETHGCQGRDCMVGYDEAIVECQSTIQEEYYQSRSLPEERSALGNLRKYSLVPPFVQLDWLHFFRSFYLSLSLHTCLYHSLVQTPP